MVDFLNEHALEVMKMLTKEWDWDVAKTVWKEESRAEGRMEGRTEGIQIGETRAANRYVPRIAELERRLRAVGQDPSRW
jgi:predicted transposase YdaD